MEYKYNSGLISFARRLRREQTDAERLLWSKLRSRQMHGYKFKRQFPFGPYILDFYCAEKKIAIELDGGQHNEREKNNADEERSCYLKKYGIVVLRFWNNEVQGNLPGVLMVIEETLSKTSPPPSPARRGRFSSLQRSGKG